jgi:hypothetical protein
LACSIEKDRVLATLDGVSYVERWLYAKYEISTLRVGVGVCCKLISLAVAAMMLTVFGMYIYHNEIGITLMVVEIMNWF